MSGQFVTMGITVAAVGLLLAGGVVALVGNWAVAFWMLAAGILLLVRGIGDALEGTGGAAWQRRLRFEGVALTILSLGLAAGGIASLLGLVDTASARGIVGVFLLLTSGAGGYASYRVLRA